MKSPLLNQIHAEAGAVLGGGDPPVVLTYGDVPGEYAAAQERCVLFDQTSRGLVRVRGPEAAAFLHRLVANPVRELAVGQGNRNLLLSSKGKVVFDLDLAVGREAIELGTPPGVGADLLSALGVYHFSEKLELEEASERSAPLALAGPAAAEVVRSALSIAVPPADHAQAQGELDGHPLTVLSLPVAGSPGMRIDGGPELAARLWQRLVAAGARPAGRILYDSLRVEAGVAEPGVDIDENVYPQEARLESAFSLSKGCYVGQEVVAKIDTYGGLNKRLVALRVSHDDPIPRGTPLWLEDEGAWRELGLVTSWAYSFALDTGLVLAYVKRRHQASGTRFRVGPGPATATVVDLPVRTGVASSAGIEP